MVKNLVRLCLMVIVVAVGYCQAASASLVSNVALNKPVTENIAGGKDATNLTDGDLTTKVAPGGKAFDYTVDLQGEYYVEVVKLYWAGQGTSGVHIQSWELKAYLSDGSLVTLASGGIPGVLETSVTVNANVIKLRISASSSANWISMMELSALGAIVPGPANVALNKPVTADIGSIYATPPANLTDGSLTTVAAPGGYAFDYTVDLQGEYYVEVVELYWGENGTTVGYIQSWQLKAQLSDGRLVTLASGGIPGVLETSVVVNASVIKLHISASSSEEWIGMEELSAFSVLNAYDAGFNAGEATCVTNYQDGFTAGFAAGETAHAGDYQNGYDAGQTAGYETGYNAGQTAGFTAGELAHANDYQDGYDAGQTVGYAAGAAAHANDYQDGYDAGYAAGEAAHANDYQNGYDAGYAAGHSAGFSDGWNALLAKLPPGIRDAINKAVGFGREGFTGFNK